MTTPISKITVNASSNGHPIANGGATQTQDHEWVPYTPADELHGSSSQEAADPLGLQLFLAELEAGIKSLFQNELNEHAREICQDVAQMQYEVHKANETAEAEHEKVLAELNRLAHLTQMFTQHVTPILGVPEG